MCDGKESVQIYDYVDMRVSVLERMYGKRLKGYRDLGYQATAPGMPQQSATDFIYGPDDYWERLANDMMQAKHRVWICSTTIISSNLHRLESVFSGLTGNGGKLEMRIFQNQPDSTESQPLRTYTANNRRLAALGFSLMESSHIQPNTVLIDDRIMWYGSLAPLGQAKETDNIMRVESPVLAAEMKSMLLANSAHSRQYQIWKPS